MAQHFLGQIDEFAPGTSREIAVAGRVIALYRIGDTFHALDGICPHAGGPLGEGTLEGTRVTCPWHGWQFDVTTGGHCLTPKIAQERFDIELHDGNVYIDLPEE